MAEHFSIFVPNVNGLLQIVSSEPLHVIYIEDSASTLQTEKRVRKDNFLLSLMFNRRNFSSFLSS